MPPSLNTQLHSTLSSVRPYFTDGSHARFTRQSASSLLLHSDIQLVRHDPDNRVLNVLHREMKTFVREGLMASFSKEDLCWTHWRAPIRALVSGAMTTVAPPSYAGIPGYEGPVCPHILNPFRTVADCTMAVKTSRVHGVNQYTFLAPHPGCQFQMKIPYYGHQKIEAEMEYSDGDDGDETDLMYSAYLSSSQSSGASAEEVENSLLKERGASSAFLDTFTSSSSSSIPGFSPQGASTPAKRPKPVPLKPGQRESWSYYSKEMAEKRAAYDQNLAAEVRLAFSQGVFKEFPRFHPAYNLPAQPLSILAPYDPSTNDGGATFSNLQYFDTSMGRVIREINTTQGAKPSSFEYLTSLTQTCAACLCEYSPDGFAAHVENGEGSPRCRNVPGCPAVPDRAPVDVDKARLTLRTFKDGQYPAFRDDSDSALGRPWLEWNSKLGIPADVWAVISTAVIVCETCRLVRTFNADRSHRASNGDCMDLGQSEDNSGKGDDDDDDDEHGDTLVEDTPLSASKGKKRV
ncbi:hypothetical protein FB446DRAFT_752645 [Lentinula raphanica]|nr:hypothetical protein FB446DRAFT_752645 [Lentinula raphanica]